MGIIAGKMVGKMILCQTDNKFVLLRPLPPMANNLPARKTAGFGSFPVATSDKKAGANSKKSKFVSIIVAEFVIWILFRAKLPSAFLLLT
jgi:hypothetical protein